VATKGLTCKELCRNPSGYLSEGANREERELINFGSRAMAGGRAPSQSRLGDRTAGTHVGPRGPCVKKEGAGPEAGPMAPWSPDKLGIIPYSVPTLALLIVARLL